MALGAALLLAIVALVLGFVLGAATRDEKDEW